MSFSLAAPLSGLPCLLLALFSGSPASSLCSLADWITALASLALAGIGITAVLEYKRQKREWELEKLDGKVLWWFMLQSIGLGISPADLAAKLGHTLQEITDSLQRLSVNGKLYTMDGEHWQLNRTVIFGARYR